MQAHWRHMALLAQAWPELFAARVTLAKEMADLLGVDHDLYVLIETVQARKAEGAEGAEHDGIEGLVRAARARQNEIRAELAIKGGALYAENVAGFVGRIAAYWDAAKATRDFEHRRKKGGSVVPFLKAAKAASATDKATRGKGRKKRSAKSRRKGLKAEGPNGSSHANDKRAGDKGGSNGAKAAGGKSGGRRPGKDKAGAGKRKVRLGWQARDKSAKA